jgi:hypothetical protein
LAGNSFSVESRAYNSSGFLADLFGRSLRIIVLAEVFVGESLALCFADPTTLHSDASSVMEDGGRPCGGVCGYRLSVGCVGVFFEASTFSRCFFCVPLALKSSLIILALDLFRVFSIGVFLLGVGVGISLGLRVTVGGLCGSALLAASAHWSLSCSWVYFS